MGRTLEAGTARFRLALPRLVCGSLIGAITLAAGSCNEFFARNPALVFAGCVIVFGGRRLSLNVPEQASGAARPWFCLLMPAGPSLNTLVMSLLVVPVLWLQIRSSREISDRGGCR